MGEVETSPMDRGQKPYFFFFCASFSKYLSVM